MLSWLAETKSIDLWPSPQLGPHSVFLSNLLLGSVASMYIRSLVLNVYIQEFASSRYFLLRWRYVHVKTIILIIITTSITFCFFVVVVVLFLSLRPEDIVSLFYSHSCLFLTNTLAYPFTYIFADATSKASNFCSLFSRSSHHSLAF